MIRLIRTAFVLLLVTISTSLFATEIKLATIAPDGSAWMERMRSAAERIESRTDGEVRLRFFPGGVMGDAEAVLRRMRLGQLHGGAFTLGELARVDPAANLYSMPFVFRNIEEVHAVRDDFDSLVLDALDEGGIVAPGISLGGFAYLFSDREIPASDPDEMNNEYRVWVQQGDHLSQTTLEAAGATPVPVPLAEVYTALQTGAINTFASTTSATIILQWHTRASHMLDMPLLMTAGTIGLDKRIVERIPAPNRDILLDELRTVISQIQSDNLEDNAEARQALKEQGMRVQTPQPSLVSSWHEMAHDIRRRAMEEGRVELPYLERLEERLERMRASN